MKISFLLSLLAIIVSLQTVGCNTRLVSPDKPEASAAALLEMESPPGADPASHKTSSAELNRQVAALRRATARFHRTEVAQEAGYHLLDGLDHCFTNPPVGDMGFHYIDAASLDLTLDALHPEAMVYAPGPNGQLKLGAVEYIVPAEAWDEAGNTAPPRVLDHDLHLNEALGVYVLHAWVWINNPDGMFEDWNPDVACL